MSRNTRRGLETLNTCYDLVAARWTKPNTDRTPARSVGQTETLLAPEEFLLRRHAKLERYPFVDHSDLPDSDLLAAIHYYISKKVEEQSTRESAYRSFDLTALIAIGIEVEEAINELLGEYGHIMYAEPTHNEAPSSSSSSGSDSNATSSSVEDDRSSEDESSVYISESMEVDRTELESNEGE